MDIGFSDGKVNERRRDKSPRWPTWMSDVQVGKKLRKRIRVQRAIPTNDHPEDGWPSYSIGRNKLPTISNNPIIRTFITDGDLANLVYPQLSSQDGYSSL